ncbi:MAG TPA: WD40 repeat domain-containing protein, partial [Gemmataceae bacterium]|nr:WD40 repeat domain-containing protein [Gemmataceae bacterium]
STQALTAGQDGTLTLWNLAAAKKPGPADEKPLKTIDAHQGGALVVAINGNGSQAVSGGADQTIKLWNLASGQLVRPFASLSEPVNALGFSRDYTQLVGAIGKHVKLWNANDGKELLDLGHPEAVSGFSLSADKTKIATGSTDRRVRVWDAKTGIELQFFSHSGPVHSVAFQNNNASILFASKDKPPVLSTLSILRAIRASNSPIHALALAAGGSQVLTASDDKSVKLWNANSGANERIFPGAAAPVRAVAVSPSGALVATGDADKNVRVYGLGDGKLLATFRTPGEPASLGFNPNSQILAAACSDKSVVTWDVVYRPGQPLPAEFGKPGQIFAHAGAATGVAFAADNVTIYTAGLDKSLKAWKFAAHVPIKNFGHGNYVDAVAFNPAGTQLATGGHEGIVRIWDVAKGQVLRQINAHTAPPAPAPIYCLAWSPDGKQVVSGSLDRSLKLWDASNGTLVKEFKAYKEKEFEKGHRDGVFCVAFSPDGKTLVSASSDRTIKFWNVATGTVLRDCVNAKIKSNGAAGAAAAHPGAIYGLRFTMQGQRLVSAGHAPRNRGYLAVWDTTDARLLYGEELDVGNINNVAVSPDGKYLAAACSPRGRNLQEANAYVIKMPGSDARQTTRAGQ